VAVDLGLGDRARVVDDPRHRPERGPRAQRLDVDPAVGARDPGRASEPDDEVGAVPHVEVVGVGMPSLPALRHDERERRREQRVRRDAGFEGRAAQELVHDVRVGGRRA